jgi:hypothetical protein
MTRPARFTQAEIARVLRAAVELGQRVEVVVEPDGTIRIRPAADPIAQAPEIVL